MKVARWIFAIAGIYGILVLAPLYFMETRIGRDTPPAITHPEYFYGFVGITLVYQIIFLMISREPVRYRPLMVVSVLEKLAWGVAAIVLFQQQRVSGMTLGFGGIDLLFGALFIVAFFLTQRSAAPAQG